MTKVLRQVSGCEEENQVPLFYAERVLDLVESGYPSFARYIFTTHFNQFSQLLKTDHLVYLESITASIEPWSHKKERNFWQRMQNAWEFGEYKVVHDCGREILLRQEESESSSDSLAEKIIRLLAANANHYIEPDDIAINTFIDAKIDFLVDKRSPRNACGAPLQGNPGFYLRDALGRRFRCFIKQVTNAQPGEEFRLKITNIPGLVLSSHSEQETILYLEPRVSPGDIIQVELTSLSHTGNSFTFRHHSYDGFLWFKRRGVNKEVFNRSTLNPKDSIVAKVLYTSDEEKRSTNGNITRLGVIKAIPVKRAAAGCIREASQDINAANFLS